MSKQYGLIIPGKDKVNVPAPVGILRKNVFGSDSEDEESNTKLKSSLNCTTNVKRQVRVAQQKALEEDPTVYQYDEIYDVMEAKKAEEKSTQEKKDRKPRYIGKLLETASKRKQEQERRVERQVQKEREAEGLEFADKESFVTTSYRRKLEELKKLEEQEKREDYLEAIGDVTKQQDLGGFYRHLYSQKLGDDKATVKEDKASTDDEPTKEVPNETEAPSDSIQKSNKKRHYRKRSLSPEKDDNEEEINQDNKQHLQSNLDADSDFSIDSSDSETEQDTKKDSSEKSAPSEVNNENEVEIKEEKDESKAQMPQWNDGFKIPEKVKIDDEVKPEVVAKKPKIDIWKKRTVGDVFSETLRRYYERKSMRQTVF